MGIHQAQCNERMLKKNGHEILQDAIEFIREQGVLAMANLDGMDSLTRVRRTADLIEGLQSVAADLDVITSASTRLNG